MKKIMSLVLAVTLLMSVFGGLTVFAADASGISDGYTEVPAVKGSNDAYSWKVDGTTLYINYTGDPVAYTSETYTQRPWQSSVENITEVVIEGTPTAIGDRTFYGMSKLEKVTFAGTEKRINTEAFVGTAIKGVFKVPKSVTFFHGQSIQNLGINVLIFDGDSNTGNIQLYKGLPYLGDLTSIVLMRPAKITGDEDIKTVKQFGGTYASGTNGMTAPSRINMLVSDASYIAPFAALTSYDNYSKDVPSDKKANIERKEFSVAPGTFGEYTLIKGDVAYGDFVTNAFYLEYTESDNTKVVEFITNGTEKGANMASGTALNSKKDTFGKMVFGFGFTQIPASFGKAYTSLKELKLPYTLTTIGGSAFDGVSTMVKANFEDTKITSIGSAAFRNSKFKELRFPETIVTISMKAFINNNALECVYFPKATTLLLGQWAFAREGDNSKYDDKNLKVIFGDVTFSPSTKVDTFAADAKSTDWRTTTIIYDSSKTTTTSIKSIENFYQTTMVADKCFEYYDEDGVINLFICDFTKEQSYNLFLCTYPDSAMDKLIIIKEGTLSNGDFVNVKYDTSAEVVPDKTKIFLWEGFSSCKPLVPALLK